MRQSAAETDYEDPPIGQGSADLAKDLYCFVAKEKDIFMQSMLKPSAFMDICMESVDSEWLLAEVGNENEIETAILLKKCKKI